MHIDLIRCVGAPALQGLSTPLAENGDFVAVSATISSAAKSPFLETKSSFLATGVDWTGLRRFEQARTKPNQASIR